jgi:putative holliday junction resolvase
MAERGSLAPQVNIALAFDFGTHRIGVASGNSLTRTAQPLTTLECRQTIPWDAIKGLLDRLEPAQLIVGVPYNDDGTATALTSRCRRFAAELTARFHLPVALVDEYLTSREAETQLRNARAQGLKRRRTTRADVDRMAAKVLLESWFEQQHNTVPK